MAEEVHVPGAGEVPKKWVMIVGGLGGGYVAFRWYQARKASAAAAAAGPAALPVDTSNTAANQGAAGYTNPDPGAGPTSTSNSLLTNAQWSTKVEQDLVNMGYDAQTVATALGLYLSNQPLTGDQQAIIRVAWAMDGKAPESPSLAIIPAQTPPTGGGSSAPPPPPPGGGSSAPPPPPPDPHAGQHWQDPQVATLVHGTSMRQWQIWHPTSNLQTLISLNPSLNVDNTTHPTMQIRTSNGRFVPN